MSYLKRLTAAVSALAIAMVSTLTFGVATAATSFTDASGIASWAVDSVNSLADAGVLSGRPDGSFDPQGQLNRAEMAKVAVLAADLTEDTTGAPHFNDVASSDWFYTFVETLYNNGVVGGINGGALDSNGLATYNPGGTLNRAEGSKILVDAFNLETAYAGTPPNFPDVASSAWFYDYVETAYAHGIINGYDNGNFGPADAITREQVAVIGQSSKEEAADGSKRRSNYTAGAASDATPDEPTTPVVEQGDGTLRVAKSASMPPAATFPRGTSSTAVAAYDFTATGDDVVLSSLVVTRTGVGEEADWTLYLYDGNNRLTSGKTINSTTQQATFTGLNMTVDAGTTKTLILKADTSSTTTKGGESYFDIESADSVTSNAQGVTGSFPIQSNKQEINTSINAGSLTVEKTGSITTPKVGEDNVTIAKFKLTSGTEAALVEEIAMIVDGSVAATDVQNAKLYQGTTELASVSAVNSKDLLVFVFDTPYEIAKGDSRNFEIKADLNTGRNGDTVKVYVDETTDIVATGGTYGFGLSVTIAGTSGAGYDGASCNTSSYNCSYSALQGGDITISSSGPSATDIAINGDDLVVMEFSISSASEASFKKFKLALTATENGGTVNSKTGGLLSAASTNNITDIKIVDKDTGATVMGPIDATNLLDSGGTAITESTDAAEAYYIFQDEFSMAAGEERNFQVTLDVENTAALNNDTIYATLKIDTTYPEIKDTNNKTLTNTTSVVPSSDITGKTMTIKSPSLTVALASSPVSDTFVKGTHDVCFAGFSLQAGDASDVKITELAVTGYIDDTGSTTFVAGRDTGNNQVYVKDIVGSVKLMVDNTQVGSTESVQTTGVATFDDVDYTVSAGSTKLIKICGDVSTDAFKNSNAESIAFTLPASSITAEDEDGNTVAQTGTANGSQSVYMTISGGGSLTVAVDAATPKEDIKIAGTSDVEISKFKFTSTDEEFIVKKLSISNRQAVDTAAAAAIDDADLGAYDNNVTKVKISYTNSSGSTETKEGFLTNGVASFSGLDLYVDKDDDAELTISANLQTISAGASASEFVDLNIAFDDFEAVAQGSGETYKADRSDATYVAAGNYLSFGTVTWTDAGSFQVADADFAAADPALGASFSITVDDGGVPADPALTLPNGTLICFSADTTCSGEDIAVITGYTDGASNDTYTATLVDDAGGTIADDTNIVFALPGGGYLTNTNHMHIKESKPTIALASDSLSGQQTQSASQDVIKFTIAADSQEKIQLRAGLQNTCEATTNWASDADQDIAVSTTKIQGTNSIHFDENVGMTADDSIFYGVTALNTDMSAYTEVGFWIQSSDVATAGQIEFCYVNGDANGTVTTAELSAGTCVNVGALAAGAWEYETVTLSGTRSDVDAYGFNIAADIDGSDTLDIYFDDIRFYAEKIKVTLASDGSLNTSNDGLVAYLKDGSTTVATGYTEITANTAGFINFVPVSGTDSTIEISKGTSKTYSVQISTTSLISTGTDDLLTASVNLGSASDGTVTPGDFWWNETNVTVKWLGQVDNTTLNGNTITYN